MGCNFDSVSAKWEPIRLSISFGPIVGGAEHLAVLGRAFAPLAPCSDVVRIHFVELIDSALVGVVPDCSERKFRLALALRRLRLLGVDGPLYRSLKQPYFQQFRLNRATHEILEDPLAVLHAVGGGEPPHFILHLRGIV